MNLARYGALGAVALSAVLVAAAAAKGEQGGLLSTPSNEAQAVASEEPAGPSGPGVKSVQVAPYSGVIPAGLLLRVPVTGIVPGNVSTAPNIKNPLAGDPNAVQRGMRDFDAFNCSGCHAANGAGGMGPSLSDDQWVYRSTPANIYLTIVQGRAAGMPSFGAMLPDTTIWELVSYIESITEKPSGKFGKTVSAQEQLPAIEQVSANRVQTPNPWRYTENFHNGQKPD